MQRAFAAGAHGIPSHQVEIRTADAHNLSDAGTGARLNPEGDGEFDAHCRIGARAMILQGTALAADTAVGAMASVKRRVEDPGTALAGLSACANRRDTLNARPPRPPSGTARAAGFRTTRSGARKPAPCVRPPQTQTARDMSA